MLITILGSSVFAGEMFAYKQKLEALGHQVNLHEHYILQAQNQMPELVARMQSEHAAVKREYNYHKYHYDEIKSSNAVLVLNFDKNGISNYIGGNTLMELGMAYVHDARIYLLNPIPQMPYTEEIESLDPIVLNGELTLIG
jgi:hypothetical protein